MRRLTSAIASVLLAAATPSSAQPVLTPAGRFQIRPTQPPQSCVTNDEGFLFRVPYLKHVRCPDGDPHIRGNFQWDLVRWGGNEFEIRHNATGRCATIASFVWFGPPSIDLRPCTSALEHKQHFKIESTTAGTFIIRTMNGKCWFWDHSAFGSQIIETDCTQQTMFLLIPA